MKQYTYIDDSTKLAQLVLQYSTAPFLILDTEFVRERTYYAQLGLIQAYDGKTLALIDPLAIDDLSSFWALLCNEKIIKVLHSCNEDLEVFAYHGKCQPTPLFDSQIAASIANMGHGIGYAKLVEQCLSVTIDKGESRTNWLKRPLSSSQLNYAANDVYYLYELYPQLLKTLTDKNRLEWVYEETRNMTKGRLVAPKPSLAYLKVKNAFQLNREQLAVLRDLASWRQQVAITKNLAVGFVLKDHTLIALAKNQPKTEAALLNSTILYDNEKRRYGKIICDIISKVEFNQPPELIDVIALEDGYKSQFKAIKKCLVSIAETHQVPIELLGSKRHIHEYLKWLWADKKGELPLLLQGWRATLAASKLAEINK